MTARSYENFDLALVSVGEGRYRARVAASPCGEPVEAEFTLPFDATRLENLLLRLDPGRSGVRRASTDPREEAARQLGEGLFEAVFDGAVGATWARSRDVVHAQGKGLRLRLQLDQAPDIAGLPWELLHDRRTNTYLAQSDRTPVVRFVDIPHAIRPLHVGGALNVLVVISAPTDLAELDVEAEWTGITEALEDRVATGSVVLDRLPEASLTALSQWLRRHKTHVLHIVGHGEFDRTRETGVLYFCDRFGRSVPVPASVLGPYIYDHDPLRLVVLNACRTSSGDSQDPFSGMAQGLVQQNSSAVVAMQFPISDRAAVTFTNEFYGAVADEYPVDQAVTYARKALLARFGSEWATPTVFTQAADGMVFDQIVAQPTIVLPVVDGMPAQPARDAATATPSHSASELSDGEVAEEAAGEASDQGAADQEASEQASVEQASVELEAEHENEGTSRQQPGGQEVEGSTEDAGSAVVARRRSRLVAPAAAAVGLLAAAGLWWAVAGEDPEYTDTSAAAAEPAESGEAGGGEDGGGEDGPTRPFEPQAGVEARFISDTPVIDGSRPDWPAMTPFGSEIVVQLEGRERKVDADWRLGWNDEHLLVFVDVLDLVLTQTHAEDPAAARSGDSVSFEFGPYLDDVPTDVLDPGDSLVILGPTESGGVVSAMVVPDGDRFAEVATFVGDEVGDVAVRLTDVGYTVEAAIPWEVLGIDDPWDTSSYAMNLLVSDAIPDGADRGQLATLQSNNGARESGTAADRYLWGTVELLAP